MTTLYCPECGYNLTGLTEHRCPECGKSFAPDLLEREAGRAAGLIRQIRLKMVFLPLLWAVLIPCWFSIPASTGGQYSPLFWFTLIVAISVVPIFVPPIWTGWTLGKQYARARRFTGPPERDDRPDWFYALGFAAAQLALMFLYFAFGMLVMLAIAFAIFES